MVARMAASPGFSAGPHSLSFDEPPVAEAEPAGAAEEDFAAPPPPPPPPPAPAAPVPADPTDSPARQCEQSAPVFLRSNSASKTTAGPATPGPRSSGGSGGACASARSSSRPESRTPDNRPQWNSSTRVTSAPRSHAAGPAVADEPKKRAALEERNLVHWRVPHEPKRVSWADEDEDQEGMDYDIPPEKFDPVTATRIVTPPRTPPPEEQQEEQLTPVPEGPTDAAPPAAPAPTQTPPGSRRSDVVVKHAPQRPDVPAPPAVTSSPQKPAPARLRGNLKLLLSQCIEAAKADASVAEELRDMLAEASRDVAAILNDGRQAPRAARALFQVGASPKKPAPAARLTPVQRSLPAEKRSAADPTVPSPAPAPAQAPAPAPAPAAAPVPPAAVPAKAPPASAAAPVVAAGESEAAEAGDMEPLMVASVTSMTDDDCWEALSVSSNNEAVLASLADAGKESVPRSYGRGRWMPPPPPRRPVVAERRASTSSASNSNAWAEVPVRRSARGRTAVVEKPRPKKQKPPEEAKPRPAPAPPATSPAAAATSPAPRSRTPPASVAGRVDPPVSPERPAGHSAEREKCESPQDRRRSMRAAAKLASSPVADKAKDPDEKKQRLEEKLRRAEMNRELIQKERQSKLGADEDKRAVARTKLEAASEHRRLDTQKRHEAAGERAQEETKKREDKARTENERVEETLFFQRAAREEKAHELRVREAKAAASEEQRKSRERERRETEAARREESLQAVRERKRDIDEERELSKQERLKRVEEAVARADEVKRLDAQRRATTAENHARRLAEQRERESKRDEEMKGRQEEKMESSAANRARSLERIRARAEHSEKRAQEVADRRKDGAGAKSGSVLYLDRAKEQRDRPNTRKRRQRLVLVMEKNAKVYTDAYQSRNSGEVKSRLSRPVSKLRSVLQSGFSAKARAAVAEFSVMVGVGAKASGDRGSRDSPLTAQDHLYLRCSSGMDILAKLIQEDVKYIEISVDERQPIILRPAGIALQHLLEGDHENVSHFVAAGGLMPVLDGVVTVADAGDEEVLTVFLNIIGLCLRHVADGCVTDVRNCYLSFADATCLGDVCLSALCGVPQLPLQVPHAEYLYSALSVFTHWVGLQHVVNREEASQTGSVEILFGLLTNLLLPGGSAQGKQGVTMSPIRGLQIDSSPGTRQTREPPRPEVSCICFLALRALNSMCRMRLDFVQRRVREVHALEFLHVATVLLIACFEHHGSLEEIPSDGVFESRPGATPTNIPAVRAISRTMSLRAALHELLLFLGYITFGSHENQKLLRWGQTPLLQLLTNLPVSYFNSAYRHMLFPTLVLACFDDAQNTAILKSEIDVEQLITFLRQEETALPPSCPATPRTPGPDKVAAAAEEVKAPSTPPSGRKKSDDAEEATEEADDDGEGAAKRSRAGSTPAAPFTPPGGCKPKRRAGSGATHGAPQAAEPSELPPPTADEDREQQLTAPADAASPQRVPKPEEAAPPPSAAETALRAMLGTKAGTRQGKASQCRQKQGAAYAMYFRLDKRLPPDQWSRARDMLAAP
eukprot:TRINITY_DN1788_c0_g1_i1.p1 TRINITY_DN1788_c0_g1~~TRINITY_DN1788_c0_g1_i1.p1  ORF type:complete len:1619 (+),score=536.79 TRINITY_DN1788_c0_g1_i1:238-4857(+)